MAITVLVVDDQPLMRSALRMCLSTESDISVVGEGSDGREAVALARRLRPDVVIMDIRMPNFDGVAATRQLTSAGNGAPAKVLIMTTFDLDEYVVEALRAGASGFLMKDATPAEFVEAVRIVAAGDAMLSPRITRRLLDLCARRLPAGSQRSAALARLTPREQMVLKLIARGASNGEIGQRLHLAESSVKSHISHLRDKLGLADRVHLVIFAYENNVVWQGDQTDGPGTDCADDGRRPAR